MGYDSSAETRPVKRLDPKSSKKRPSQALKSMGKFETEFGVLFEKYFNAFSSSRIEIT
jgi:hypothetical protein